MKLFSRIVCAFLLVSILLTGCAPVASSGNETTAPTEAPAPEFTYTPKENVKNILMIGNSFCYYFVEELAGVAKAAGYDINVYNLYYSGRKTKEHYIRLTSDQTADYDLYKTTSTGRTKVKSKCTIKDALGAANWDVITLQEHFNPSKADLYATAKTDTIDNAKLIFDYLKQNHPNADLLWHQTWAYEVGYKLDDTSNANRMADVERQTRNYENMKKVSQEICKANDVAIIPAGDAWAVARANPALGQTLCERYASGKYNNDHYHDGESGGQYLNACVWFEVLFGKSCIGNTFAPQAGGKLEAPMTAERIQALQQAAHEAVAALYGANYAK